MKSFLKEAVCDALAVAIGIALIISGVVFPIYLIYRIDTGDSAGSYAATASVVSVDGDAAVFETADGNLWSADVSGFSTGDAVVLLFDGNNTSSVFDDEIRQVIPMK